MSGKYRNKLTELDGITFHSKAEARHYCVLKLRERAGEISHLRCQPSYDIMVNGVKICRYIGDFQYVERATGLEVLVDVKGVKTAEYRLKKKLMKVVLGVDIVEVAA